MTDAGNFHQGGRLNINMSSYQYRDSHFKDRTVSQTVLSLTLESPHLGKTVFILRRGPGLQVAAVSHQSDDKINTRWAEETV